MRPLTAAQNARSEGRESAAECPGPKSKENLAEWRETYLATIAHDYENGADCALCPADAPREEYLRLLVEWEQGFDGAATLLVGAPAERAAAITQIAVSASALCSLLGVMNILPEAARLGNLRTCAHLADGIASELSVFFADVQDGEDA